MILSKVCLDTTAPHVLYHAASILVSNHNLFFCRQNPETTFEVYVEVAYPRTGGTLSGICMFDYDTCLLYEIAVQDITSRPFG